jgi:hypothetical protein
MKYLILTDHPRNDLRVSMSQKYLDSVTLQIPRWLARFFWIPGYCSLVYLLTFFYRFDRLYCHDLFLSYAGIKRGNLVFADLHENFHDCYNHSRFRFGFVKWFFRSARIEKMITKIRERAIIITVSRPLAKIYGTERYYPNVGMPRFKLYKNDHLIPVIVFVGRDRGMDKIHWDKVKGNYLLRILPNDNDPENRIDLLSADIGIIPNQPSPQMAVCSPWKLFTYMNYGLCVVCGSWMENVRDIIQTYGCGVATSDIEGKLSFLLKHIDLAREIGEHGRDAVKREYNEEKMVKPLFGKL